LGAVCQGGDAGAGSGPFVRGFAWLGVGGGGCGVGGGGGGWTRGLSSSSGALSASSLSDKLAAAHAAADRAARDNAHLTPGEKAARGEGVADRLGASLKTRIELEKDPEGLLRLVADELPNLSAETVSQAFCKLGAICESRHVAHDSFRGLMVRVQEMCADRQLHIRGVTNIMQSVAKMRAAEKLASDDAGVEGMLAALEQRLVHVAPKMTRGNVSGTILAFGALGRSPGAAAWEALEAAVVRAAPRMSMQEVKDALGCHARLELAPGAAALAALEAWAYTHPRFSST
jgi:hypothetical protein